MQGELSHRVCVVEPMLLSCDSVNPKSDLFLDFDTMKPLAKAYAYLDIDANNLKAQAVVAKTMFTQQCQDKVSFNPRRTASTTWHGMCMFGSGCLH